MQCAICVHMHTIYIYIDILYTALYTAVQYIIVQIHWNYFVFCRKAMFSFLALGCWMYIHISSCPSGTERACPKPLSWKDHGWMESCFLFWSPIKVVAFRWEKQAEVPEAKHGCRIFRCWSFSLSNFARTTAYSRRGLPKWLQFRDH